MNEGNKKVFVGISGGVDSSVSALLLKEQGYDVTGVFIKVWYPDFISCDWRSEMQDAMRVCAKLDIPFLMCDAEKEYKEGVIDYMINEYKEGRTPNPDVMCNKYVKFKAFLDFAMEKGADYIATGHYAQNIDGELSNSVDEEKDQTYFLWNLTSEILKKVLFPIGHLEKDEVRKIANKNGLLTANKKDSQGLCFIGHVNMKDFLRHYLDTSTGDVLDESGQVIGIHDGVLLYTIGERHSFRVFQDEENSKALFVSEKDLEKNTITVSEERMMEKVSSTNLIATKTIFNSTEPKMGDEVFAKIRYRQPNQKCLVKKVFQDQIEVEFNEPQEAITRGQSIVFYSNGRCLGGGIIT